MSQLHHSSNGDRSGRRRLVLIVTGDSYRTINFNGWPATSAGYAVITAEDGREAFDGKRERPDVVISDVSMPA